MQRTRAALLLALVATTAGLAGCIGTDDATGDVDADGDGIPDAIQDWTFTDFIVQDHDHVNDPHDYRSPTVEAVAHNILSDGDTAYSYLGELDSRAGLTAVAVVGQGSTPGFVLLDTSDPTQPTVLGRAEAPSAYAVDVKLTSDGAYALLATQQVTTGRLGGEPTPEGLVDGTYAAKNGIMVWDLADRSQPELVFFAPSEAYGCHMISIAEIDGDEWVFCINQVMTVYRFERGPGPALVQAGAYWPFGADGYDTVAAKQSPTGARPHDMTFQADPLDGTPVLSVSHWDLGVVVLDVSIPTAPQELLRWTGQGAEHYQGYAHSAMLTELDGKRILVVTPETTSDVLPAIWVLDATDMDAPELVAEWTNPGGHTSLGLLMTTHQFQLVNGKMYLTYNHNGVWVLELATLIEHGGNAPDHAEILGVHLPDTTGIPLYDEEQATLGSPAVWDLNVVGGYILTTDRYTGLHVLHLAGDPTTPETTSFA